MIALDKPIAFDPYADNREMGGFILIDRVSNATVGCGMISFALRPAFTGPKPAPAATLSARI